MAYELTKEQQELRAVVKSFLAKKIAPVAKAYDESGEFPLALYQEGFALGLHMLDIPEPYGGAGLDHESFGVLLEEMGYWEPGFAMTVLASSLACKCILLGAADEALKETIMDRVAEGAIGAFCLTEPDSGSDAASLKTSYQKVGDEYVLNGSKCFITNGTYADFYIIFATKDRSLGAKGISAFLVERNREGFMVDKHENKMGLRLSDTNGFALTDVHVPANHLLGQEGQGFRIAMADLDAGRLNNASVATGLCQAALDQAVSYAKTRVTFGKPIIKHPVVRDMLAHMATKVEASRQLTRYGMYRLNQGRRVTKEAAMAKAFSSDCAVSITSDAVQILGGYGYSREYPVEKMMRDAKIFQIFEGTNQIQNMVIGRELEK